MVTTEGSYDFDDGYYVSGMVTDDAGNLIMGTGESSMTLQLKAP